MLKRYDCPRCKKKDSVNIIGVTDDTLEVECLGCDDSWVCEPDGLGDAGLEWAEAMAAQEAGEI